MASYAYGNAGSFYYPDHPHSLVLENYQINENEITFITMNPSLTESSSNSLASAGSGGPGSPANSTQEGKSRLRRACDSCSIRKVKCDEEGPPCQACAALDIPCTYERPSRRRGPPNRHAEAIKRKRRGSPPSDAARSSPSSTLSTPAPSLGPQQSILAAESICPWPLLIRLVDDYFTYIHPLVPFPHEPTFRAALHNREDTRDPKLLALLASMIGALVASFPRKPRQHLKALRNENLFPRSMRLVERCHHVAAEARGPGYLDKDPTLFDALTSYLLGLTGGYTFRLRQSKLYLGECLSILRSLGFHKPGKTTVDMGASGSREELSEDLVTREIGRRAFWVLFVGARSIQQLGGSITELFIPPETPAAPYPPLPIEVDDSCILPNRIIPQPSGKVSEIVGFNANVKVYRSYEALSVIDMTYGISSRMGWDWQRMLIGRALLTCKHALDGLPAELRLTLGTWSSGLEPNSFSASDDFAEAPPGSQRQKSAATDDGSSELRRRKQYEIQKANIYVSQLGTRSHIVEKYWTLCEHNQQQSSWADQSASSSYSLPHMPMKQPSALQNFDRQTQVSENPSTLAMTGAAAYQYPSRPQGLPHELENDQMASERESIIRDLLMVLSSISQENMEPNGGSLVGHLIFKIRMMASTLLDVPRTRKGALALQADQYLARFLDILMKLERSSPLESNIDSAYAQSSSSDVTTPGTDATGVEVDEEAELRHWADLSEYQAQFIKAGGFVG